MTMNAMTTGGGGVGQTSSATVNTEVYIGTLTLRALELNVLISTDF